MMANRRPNSLLFLTFIALITGLPPVAAQEASDSGIGFMVRREFKITSALQLSGAKVCMLESTQKDVQAYFAANSMELTTIVFNSGSDVFSMYDGNHCNAVAADASKLSAALSAFKYSKSDDHVILPERLGTD